MISIPDHLYVHHAPLLSYNFAPNIDCEPLGTKVTFSSVSMPTLANTLKYMLKYSTDIYLKSNIFDVILK